MPTQRPTRSIDYMPTYTTSYSNKQRPYEVPMATAGWHTFPPTVMNVSSPESPKFIPVVPTNSPASFEQSQESSWNTDRNYSCPSDSETDDFAVEDDESEAPAANESIVFSRSQPRLTRSLSLLGLMIAGMKEWARSPTNSTTSFQSSQRKLARASSSLGLSRVSNSGGDSNDGLQMKGIKSK